MARVFVSHSSRDNEPAARLKTWLIEQGFEAPFLDFDKHSGIPPGADWERTLYRELSTCEAVLIVHTPSWLESKWCFAEFTQARALGKPIFPVVEAPDGETLIAPDIQALDLRRDREGGLERLARELTRIALDAQGGFEWDRTRPPFPGLMAFQAEDAAVYFGRDDDIRRVIERLNARRAQGGARLLALLGASGAGKSSLLRAGVLPRLARDRRAWVPIPPLRPQRHPVDELARTMALAAGKPSGWRDLRECLLGPDPARVLGDWAQDVRLAAGAADGQVLLVIDQAEELYGTADVDEAARFEAILAAVLDAPLPLMAILALRSDHLDALQRSPALGRRFEEVSLGPLPLARVPQIIEGPARVAGLAVDDELILEATRDAATEDALPLLAFALRELHDRYGDRGRLTVEDYRALGDPVAGLSPLENAVRRAADEVLAAAQPGEAELQALKDAFVPALVRVNDAGEYVRQAAAWSDLPAAAHDLLERLVRARLLVRRQEGEAGVVEVTHEALLRKWPRLRAWLDEERAFLIGRQQLLQDQRDWELAADADKQGALLTGLKLARARGWLIERPHQLTTALRSFVQASLARAEADERRAARQRRIVTGGSIAAAVVLAVLAGLAAHQWQQAQQALAATERAFDARAREQVRFVWMDLGTKRDEVQRLTALAQSIGLDPAELVPDPLDTHPDDGRFAHPDGFRCGTWLEFGFRYLYCTVRDIVSFERLQAISGLRIFREGGPHDEELNLDDVGNFGHYNPEFLDWVDRYIIPEDSADPRFNHWTRLVYENHVGPVARALYHSHEVLFSDAATFKEIVKDYEEVGAEYREMQRRGETREARFASETRDLASVVAEYQAALDGGRVAQWTEEGDVGERFRWLADYLATARNDDWYLANTAGGFWVRRSIDGTQEKIFALVEKVLRAFEPEVLER